MQDLLQASERVDGALAEREKVYPSVTHPSYHRLLDTIDQFWAALEDVCMLNPWEPAPDAHQKALAVLDHPVLIGGTGKAGTSLVRHLLDGHPQLVIFPVEGMLPAAFGKRSRATLEERRELLIQHSFQRLIAHDLGGGPNWLLSGGESNEIQPYLNFVTSYRRYVADTPLTPADLIRAAVYAYLTARPVPEAQRGQARYWVEKTTANLLRTGLWFRAFPNAKFIFVVRDPRGIIASSKSRYLKKYGSFDLLRTVEEIRRRWPIILDAVEAYGPGVCYIVQYEHLITDLDREMQHLAAFLDIPFDDSLLRPIIAGQPAGQNTGYEQPLPEEGVSTTSVDRWRTELSQAEIDFVSGYVHPFAACFGYEPGNTAFGGFVRAALRLRRDYRRAGLNFSLRRALKGRSTSRDAEHHT
jgi:hypothetical protein